MKRKIELVLGKGMVAEEVGSVHEGRKSGRHRRDILRRE